MNDIIIKNNRNNYNNQKIVSKIRIFVFCGITTRGREHDALLHMLLLRWDRKARRIRSIYLGMSSALYTLLVM